MNGRIDQAWRVFNTGISVDQRWMFGRNVSSALYRFVKEGAMHCLGRIHHARSHKIDIIFRFLLSSPLVLLLLLVLCVYFFLLFSVAFALG